MTYRIERVVVEGADSRYVEFDLSEGAVVLHSFPYPDMLVLLVAVPVNEETAE